jgi:hypothetical protein
MRPYVPQVQFFFELVPPDAGEAVMADLRAGSAEGRGAPVSVLT